MISLTLALAAALTATPRTMRLDYVHTGTASEEQFALDGVALEGAWAGPPNRLIDNSNLGKYYFEVIDAKTKRLLYSRGFARIFGEWELTPEAGCERRAFEESLRFPAPSAPVEVVLKKRDRQRIYILQCQWINAAHKPHSTFIE